MGKYFAKRLGMAILTIFLVACLTFLLMNAVPGSPWLSEKTNMDWISLSMYSCLCI